MLDAGTTAQVMERLRTSTHAEDPLSALTEQEREILDLIGEGLTQPRRSASACSSRRRPSRTTCRTCSAKLGMQRRTQAAVMVSRVHAREDMH